MTISFRYRFARALVVFELEIMVPNGEFGQKAKRYLFFHLVNAGADDFSNQSSFRRGTRISTRCGSAIDKMVPT
ncbi:hypothetical protein BH79_31920 [Pseudomonas aeruginosa C0324C]|nr:hypothetical protein BH79_31920 [Pseudomonas aeruginosa C0324C]